MTDLATSGYRSDGSAALIARTSREGQRLAAYEWLRLFYVPALALLAFSYPLTTVILLNMNIATGPVNLVIKSIIAVLFIISLYGSIHSKRKIPLDFIPLLLFFVLYGIRLLYDVLIKESLLPGSSSFQVFSYFFGLTFLPCLSIGMAFDRTDVQRLQRAMFIVLILANVALTFHILSSGVIGQDDAFSGRFQVDGDVAGTAIINPITVSLMGALLGLFVIGRLAAYPKISLYQQAAHIGLFGLGIFNLLSGGSRGPIIDMAVSLLFVAASVTANYMGIGRLKIGPRIAIYMVVLTALMVYWAMNTDLDIKVFDRFRAMIEPGSGGFEAESRSYIFAAAWSDFSDNPFFGSGYLVLDGTTFPHNSFLEALISVGFLGGLAYIFSFWMFLRGVWSALLGYALHHAYPIALCTVCLMALSMTSGSVGQAPEIWAMMSLMMSMSSIGIGRRNAAAAKPGGRAVPTATFRG